MLSPVTCLFLLSNTWSSLTALDVVSFWLLEINSKTFCLSEAWRSKKDMAHIFTFYRKERIVWIQCFEHFSCVWLCVRVCMCKRIINIYYSNCMEHKRFYTQQIRLFFFSWIVGLFWPRRENNYSIKPVCRTDGVTLADLLFSQCFSVKKIKLKHYIVVSN